MNSIALTCPSAQPGMPEARLLGVVLGTPDEPRIAFVKRGATADEANFHGLDPTRVARYAARCQEGRCAQYSNGRCSLGARITAGLEKVTEALPSCQVRDSCRWHAEQGDEICLRCSQVVTLVSESRTALAAIAAAPTRSHAAEPASGSPPPPNSPDECDALRQLM